MALIDNKSVHQHALKALEMSDMMLAHAPQLKLDEVHTIEKVTPEWLTEVLGANVPGAKVEKIQIVNAHEGMTSRHKWRLVWNAKGQEGGLPTALFIKITPENVYLRETLAMIHMAELESHVYNDLQPELCGLIPKSYYCRSYPGGRFIIILEDIEEQGITPHWMADACSIDFARAVAVTLATIHSRYWDSERFGTDMTWVRPRSRRFGELWLKSSFNDSYTKFLQTDVGKNLPSYVQDLLKKWNENRTTIHEYWDSKPPTLVHGDSHLGNTLEYADGSAGYFDWQCLFRSYGYRDLAYFLMSALTVDQCKDHEADIFNLYTDTLEQHGIKIDRQEAWRDYCLLTLESFDAGIKTITRGGYGHAQHATLRMIETVSATAQKHDVAAILDKVIESGSV